jgi:hypothetical protein
MLKHVYCINISIILVRVLIGGGPLTGSLPLFNIKGHYIQREEIK